MGKMRNFIGSNDPCLAFEIRYWVVVPVEGIEPPLLAEHDFEFVRVYQFRHTGFFSGA